MKKTKRIMSLLLVMVITVGMTFMTGCSKKSDPAKSLVVTVGDNEIYLNEMMYYIFYVESTGAQYDAAYQQYTGQSYWDMEVSDGVTMREQAKTYVMDMAEMYEILYDKAVKAGLTLTDDEKTQAGNNADQILKNISKDQLKLTGFTKDTLTKIQEKVIVGGKYYQKIIDDAKLDYDGIKATIKKEDYRQYNTEYLFTSTKKLDDNQKSVDLTAEEKAAAKSSLTAALEKVKSGEEFSKIVEGNDKLSTNTLNFTANDTTTAEQAYKDAAMKLADDAYTQDIVETDTGYYIIKMVDSNSTEAYDKAVNDATSKAEQDAFNAEYDKIKKDYKITINTKVWDPIVMGKTTLIPSTPSSNTVTGDTTSTSTADDNTTADTSTEEATTGE
ncbi:peptidylprolyl isomerase [Anaerocolumna sp. MB42-C2]|uniref:peptidylprolyl isomerase n=1 Tax=Anaerocolumna sp. MB42-C2 TaxID=3070997 RepID=UPI0027E00E16|nr:peptidylprolyl isomerase [Anaerocolumna sp. MB42-C2]WMJ87345.1 peptidylprolyl isomerase [Anaerocolumna sp. MB42-C2]